MTRPPRPTALVTGASGGIGESFARRLAADHDVVLVARSEDKLAAVRDELAGRHPDGRFDVVVADLSTTAGPATVLDALDGRDVDVLVNNAGAGYHGQFVDEPEERVAGEIALNCSAVAVLARALLPGMVERGRGGIVNVSSTAGFQPIATMAVYAATKAFVLAFSEALHVETRGTGVHVVALCPGGTETGFFAASGSGEDFLTTNRQTPSQVVDAALGALARNRAVEVPGWFNKIGALGYRLVPRSVIARASEYIVRAT